MALWILAMSRHTIRQALTNQHAREASHKVSQFSAHLPA